jgi:hypothetical protein
MQGGGRTSTGTVAGVLLRCALHGAALPAAEPREAAARLEHLDEDVGGGSPHGG